MSSMRRTRTTRSIFTAVAIGAVAAVGLVVAAPGSGAFATGNPNSPEARVGHSIESGHLLDDVTSGRITEADVIHAAKTGIEVNGQHIDNWMDLSPEQTAAADAQAASLRAAAASDPKMAASLESMKAALHASPTSDGISASATTGGSITESKHWYNHLVHWYTLYINHDWLRGLIGAGAAVAAAAVCSFFALIPVTCATVGGFMAATIVAVSTGHAPCSKGIYIKLPDTWNSHCEQ